jgi:hypothetical protein
VGLASVKDENRVLVIHFDKIFNQDISHFNDFLLSKKRNFVNISVMIAETINVLLKKCNNLSINYLALKYKIITDKDIFNEKEFIESLFKTVLTEEVILLINNEIESTYTISLDEETKRTKNANEELQFTDIHAKITLKTSMAMKLVIPIISEYLNQNNIKENETLFMEIFLKIFKLFNIEGIDILNKIFKLINSRVISTRYSDKVMWSYLKNMGVNIDTLTRSFYRKIIINIVPKLRDNTNIVKFLHVVLKNFIKFQFTVNFPLSYKSINLNQTDSEGLSDFDKMEINMARLDEGNSIINKLTISSTIKRFLNSFQISNNEFNYYKENIVINKLQTNLLSLFFARHMGSYNTIRNCSFDEYVLLCIIMKKWLKQNGYNIIDKFILSKPERYVEKKSINKKDFLNKLISSKKYNNILNNKYGFTIQTIVDSGAIMQNIATLKTNKFYSLPDFIEDIVDENEGILIDEKIENISDEFLNFVEMI